MRPGEFLNLLWPIGLAGAASIWFKQSKSTIHVPLSALHADWAEEDDFQVLEAQMDTYTSPGLRQLGLEPGQAGRKQDVVALSGFVLDIDMAHGIHKANTKTERPLPTTEADVDRILDGGPEPTFVIDSGGGIQPWFLFPEPWLLPDNAARIAAAHAYKSFYLPYQQRATALGFHLDKGMATIQHLFRLPGSKNYKFDDPKPVEVIYRSASRIAIPSVRLVESKSVSSKQPGDSLDNVRQWMQKLRPTHPCKQAIEDVLAGRSFSEPGSRNDTMYQVCSTIAWLTPARELEIEDLVELLRPSLAVWAAEPTAEKSLEEEMEVAARMFESAIENRAEKDNARNQVLAGVARGMSRVIGRQVEQAEPSKGHEKVENKSETEDDEQKLEQVLSAAVVQYRSNFYCYSFGNESRRVGYYGPYTKEEFLTQLKSCWENADEAFTLDYENDKGDVKDKTHVRILKEYATGADKLIGHIDLQESYFDLETLTFHDAKCPFRVIEPAYDPLVDEWLTLLGGDRQDKLKDWLAAVPMVNRPLSALYLEGPPGIGKSDLLAPGVARLWRETGPSRFADIIDHNGDMFACPFILLDEGLPKRASQTSAFIRSLIAASEHTYREKYIVNHKVMGCVRLMIAANNDRVLAHLANEDLNEVDIEAITDRFLHVKTDDEPAKWIRTMNKKSRSVIDEWKTQDKIARHVLWLRHNRTVPEGKRFRVDGEAEEIARALLVSGDRQEIVLEWIARFCLEPKRLADFYRQAKKVPMALIGNGQVLVNVQALLDCSDKYRPGLKDRLGPVTIGRVLIQLSDSKRRIGPREDRIKYHLINFENVKKVAETLQLDWGTMYRNVTADADFSPVPGPRVPKLALVPMPEDS
jgi:hypothetical protein